jgi:hypothetical protein
MGNKKKSRPVIVFCVLILLLIGLPFIIWRFEPVERLNIAIVDKTVPDTTYREHSGFMWILNNLKIRNSVTEDVFKYDRDYYGFMPLPDQKYSIIKLPEDLAQADIIYLADTYGVYEDDFLTEVSSGKRSGKIHGGLDDDEIDIIKGNLNQNTIIGEFNILASPTEEDVSDELEEVFGLSWTGWIGRYFSDLSEDNPEIPYWMKENYAMQNGVKWNIEGPGIVVVDSDDIIIVLRKGIELGSELLKMDFADSAMEEFKVKDRVNYYYWFEISDVDDTVEVLADYDLDLTKEGEELFKSYGLPSKFPAVVRREGDYTSYYFSGDFADCKSVPRIYSVWGMNVLNRITTLDEDTNQNYFYWNVYYPLIKGIVENMN